MEALLGILIGIAVLFIVVWCVLLVCVWADESLPFRFYYECPFCHKQLKYVYHKCPVCNRVHKNLFPDLTHIFYVHCKCGRILQTRSYSERIKYEACCPECMRSIGTEYEVYLPACLYEISKRHKIDKFYNETPNFTFPLAGGTSSGKTAFLMSSIQVLTTSIAKKFKRTPSFHSKENQDYAKKMERMFQNGVKPEKTYVGTPEPFCIEYQSTFVDNKRICLYDPAGELFAADHRLLEKQTCYDNMSGLIFIVDPFALRGVKEERRRLGIINSDSLSVCEEDQEKCLNRLLISLENRRKSRSTKQRNLKKLPCAVVVTKADALNFNVGDKSIKEFVKQNSCSKNNAASNFCRDWLYKQGEGNFVNTLEAEFRECRYFFVSSLGKRTTETTGAFHPFGIEVPWLWLLKLSSENDSQLSNYDKENLNLFLSSFMICLIIGFVYAIMLELIFDALTY